MLFTCRSPKSGLKLLQMEPLQKFQSVCRTWLDYRATIRKSVFRKFCSTNTVNNDISFQMYVFVQALFTMHLQL